MKFLLVFAVTLRAFVLFTHGYPHAKSPRASAAKLEQDKAPSVADMYMQSSEQQIEASRINGREFQQGKAFYPAYAPFESQPLGHSRPYYYQQEGAYSQRAVSPFQQLAYDTYRGGGGGGNPSPTPNTHGLLGSGNFGVISGGTFYNDNDHEQESSNFEQQYSPYYHNGHGRPSLYYGKLGNPRPQQHEQFANFRDFADINTPSYSQYVVVYVNKNSSKQDDHSGRNNKAPKNIIEQLAMLDLEITTPIPKEIPTKKLSKSKRKLALLLPEKKSKRKELAKTTTTTADTLDLHEPLLALS